MLTRYTHCWHRRAPPLAHSCPRWPAGCPQAVHLKGQEAEPRAGGLTQQAHVPPCLSALRLPYSLSLLSQIHQAIGNPTLLSRAGLQLLGTKINRITGYRGKMTNPTFYCKVTLRSLYPHNPGKWSPSLFLSKLANNYCDSLLAIKAT